MSFKNLVIGSLVILFTILCCSSKDHDSEVHNYIDSLIKANNFNGNLLVVKNNTTIFKASYGLANFYTGNKLNDSSIFLLCSISKQFTAMGIMILQEEGKLNYDDDIKKYIPELPYESITIRNMLTHTSGLPPYDTLLQQRLGVNHIARNNDIIEMLYDLKPPVLFNSGERWEYSDTAYELLTTVIERVSGQSYGDFLSARIFEPLEMTNTFNCITRRTNKESIINYALPFVYSDSLRKYVSPDSLPKHHMVITLDGTQGAGSINSTLGDMYKWSKSLRSEKIVKKSTLDQAFIPVKLNSGQTYNYGFGWFLENGKDTNNWFQAVNLNTINIAIHPGRWPGYTTFIIHSLNKDNFILMLSNNESNSYLIAKNIFAKLNHCD